MKENVGSALGCSGLGLENLDANLLVASVVVVCHVWCAVGSVHQVVVVVVVVVIEMPGGVGNRCSTHGSPLVSSGVVGELARDATVVSTTQAGAVLEEDVNFAVAVAAAATTVAAVTIVSFDEVGVGGCDVDSKVNNGAPRN